MKVVKTVTFNFLFKGFNEKGGACKCLQDFLHKYNVEKSISYHTSEIGVCEVVFLNPDNSSADLEHFATVFFDFLKKETSILWAKVNYIDETEKIVLNNMDYCRLNVDGQDIRHGDMIYVVQR